MAEKRKCTLHLIGGLAGGFVLGWIIKNLVHPIEEEDEFPEPGLIVISPPKTYTRGFEGYHDLTFGNVGEENLTQVKLMLVDNKGIFDRFDVCYDRHWEHPYLIRLYESVLNRFQENHLWTTDDSYDFPAWITRTFRCGGAIGGYGSPYCDGVLVKPNAPIGVHTLTWRITYTTYSLAREEVRVPWKVTIYEALNTPILLYPDWR